MPINATDVWPGPVSNEALTRERERETRNCVTWLHSPVFHSTGQSIMLQNCWARGGGCGQRSAPTGSVLLPPRATSWMQWTSRVWTPPPHDRLHEEKSDVFHLGGHGTSLHVRVIASGLRSIGQRCGLTRTPSSSRMHSIIDS